MGNAAPAQASQGASLLKRALGLVPLLAGVAQLVVGFMITRGTIPIAGAPLIGSIPKVLLGGLVAGSSTQQIFAGVRALLGK
jgi:hypothetical protein